jgi:hypothetical protein
MARCAGGSIVNAPAIVPADHSGGATTSHTIVIAALEALLAAVGAAGTFADFERAVLEDNVLGKDTIAARRRTLRYLRELYVLREDSLLFRALGDLWNDDSAGHRLLAGLCALARDPVFRASAQAIFDSDLGDEVTSADLADAVMKSFPESYNESTLAKIGRNTSSSWEQTGHLEAVTRTVKVRRRAVCTPATTAFALFLGHLDRLAGGSLFDTLWVQALDQPKAHLIDLAKVASQRSLIDFRHSGGITEVGFGYLLRPMEGRLL